MGSMGGLLVKPLPDAQRENDLRPPLQDAIYRRGKISQPAILIPTTTGAGVQGARVDVSLQGWVAQTIQVDNYSKQFVFFPDAGIFAAPGQVGLIIPVKDAGNIHAVAMAPPGITQPAAGTGSCIIRYYEEAFPPASGVITTTF